MKVRALVRGMEGVPKEPLGELDMWEQFIAKYPSSELVPRARLETIYLHRALYEIYGYQAGGYRDPGKAAEHRQAAESECQRVVREHAGTVDAAQAARTSRTCVKVAMSTCSRT